MKTDTLKSDLDTLTKYLRWALDKAEELRKDSSYSTNTMIQLTNLADYVDKAHQVSTRIR